MARSKGRSTRKLSDRDLMLRAVTLARKCKSENGKVSPKVGAVVARNGQIIGEAFRGELAPRSGGTDTRAGSTESREARSESQKCRSPS
jgi:hypothetical protein